MSYLLDTNVVSALRNLHRAPPSLSAWASSVRSSETFLSAITLYEVERGIQKAEHDDRAFANILRTWLEGEILPNYAGRILPVSDAVAIRCAQLQALRTVQLPDALIAATALVHDVTVVTRNTKHFTGLGLRLLNPWDVKAP